MGVCYDCLITVNGRPRQRACMTLVHDQMEIELDVD
jgi:predicted molibdopterin-dependent oxidoreductase YjgC